MQIETSKLAMCAISEVAISATRKWCNHHHTGWDRGYDVQNLPRGFPRKHSNASPIRKSYSGQSRAHLAASTEWVSYQVNESCLCKSISPFTMKLYSSTYDYVIHMPLIQPPLGCCCWVIVNQFSNAWGRRRLWLCEWTIFNWCLPLYWLVVHLIHTDFMFYILEIALMHT